jgi:tyrosyl-tRNA synthetase
MFGKLMSIPDELMWSYYELATDRTPQEIAELKNEVQSGKLHPMDAKMRLAEEVVSDFQGAEAGKRAAENFQRVFRDRQAPEEMTQITLIRREGTLEHPGGVISTLSPKWSQLLAYLRQVESVGDAVRLIEQGGFEIDGQIVRDSALRINASTPAAYKIRLGKKKFLRIIVE